VDSDAHTTIRGKAILSDCELGWWNPRRKSLGDAQEHALVCARGGAGGARGDADLRQWAAHVALGSGSGIGGADYDYVSLIADERLTWQPE
jgi:hypothetical protein